MSRQPNGYGSCHKIGGNKKRAKPYRVRVTDGWTWDDEKCQAVQKYRTLGYYATRKEGNIALAEYNKNPSRKGTANIQFSDLYQMWMEHKDPQGQTLKAYRNAYNLSLALHGMKVSDIRVETLESIMDNASVGVSSQKLLKTFWNQIFDFAVARDIVQKNYSKTVKTKDKQQTTSSRKPFTKDEIQLLWDNVDRIENIDTVLILIYTAMRPSEMLSIHKDNVYLDQNYMIGGIKTNAGRNRVIPLHKCLLPFIEHRLQSSEYLFQTKKGKPLAYSNYLKFVWNPIMSQLGLNHTPHECRHTGISLMTMAGVDERLLKKIVGHSTGDVTARYTHAYIETLVEAVNKINMPN